ncbi:SAM-dependent methyltransferase, partial [archaeon]
TLALALATSADTRIVGLDVSEDFAALGKGVWRESGVDHKIDFRVGPAVDSLDAMIASGEAGTYDLVFIDADKSSYELYYERSLVLLRPGGVIAVDNVLWSGLVVQPLKESDKDTETIVRLNEQIRQDSRVKAVMLPVADGCYLVRKL